MKAAICRTWGPPSVLTVEEVTSPALLPTTVRIKVHAAEVGFQDVLMIAGKYQSKPDFPFIPGNEVSGKVLECGSEATAYKPGDRVLALVTHGGYAEQVVAPEAAVVKLPSEVDFVSAAVLGMAYGTAFNGLVDRAQLAPGETLLVRGAGSGVGLAAVDLARELGATIVAAASSNEKRSTAAKAGAHHVINTSVEDLRTRVMEITAGKGADVIFDPIGADFKQSCLRCIARKGRILVVGFAGGEIPAIPANYLILKYCSILGVNWGPFYGASEPQRFREVLGELLRMCASGKIHPGIGHTYPLERVSDALTLLASRKAVGRIALICD
jgi:NADPH2:quinone reductase